MNEPELHLLLRGIGEVSLEPGTRLRPFLGNENHPEGGVQGIWKGQQSCKFRWNDVIEITAKIPDRVDAKKLFEDKKS